MKSVIVIIFLTGHLASDQRFDFDSLRQTAVIRGAGFACAEKGAHLELITGYVYTYSAH